MNHDSPQPPIGVLFSGGLDSAALVAHLAAAGRVVQPIYVAGGLNWEKAELAAARDFLAALAHACLRPLVVLDMPLADLYHGHWSLTQLQVPQRGSPDESVFLPGRNPLLIIKARLWCQLNGLGELASGSLATNPFADGSEEFFARFEAALDLAMCGHVRLSRPFGSLTKRDVLARARQFPLGLTFSCLSPHAELHCGNCNKCAERARAFAEMGIADPTPYALELQSPMRTASCFE